MMNRFVGIDSVKSVGSYRGWAVFWLDGADRFGFGVYATIEDVMSEFCDASSILIDIPLGLPESREEEQQRPERELRRRLPGKAASVFNPPCRQAVYAGSKDEAKELNLRYLGKSLSEQSLGFAAKIREADCFLYDNYHCVGRLRESHPEYAFALLNGGQPLVSQKKEPQGFMERHTVLARSTGCADAAVLALQTRYPRVLLDDFLDAMVLAVVGRRGHEEGWETIPSEPVCDRRGIPMEIVGIRRAEGSAAGGKYGIII